MKAFITSILVLSVQGFETAFEGPIIFAKDWDEAFDKMGEHPMAKHFALRLDGSLPTRSA